MKKIIKIIFFTLFTASFLGLSSEEIDKKIEPVLNDSIAYAADEVKHDDINQKLHLYGNAKLNYGTAEITADSLILNQKTNQATAFGRLFMKDQGQNIIGDKILYDIESESGLISYGAAKFDLGYYYGDEMRKVGEKIFDIDNGKFTTSDLAEPDFWFWSKKMRVYHDDKVVAKPVVMYVNHFPVFGFPFATFSLKRGRQAGFLMPSPDYNTNDGKSIRNIGYYYPYKDFADFLLEFDYSEKTGWELRFNNVYRKRYKYDGSFFTRLKRYISGPDYRRDEWLLRYRHNQRFTYGGNFRVNLNFVSSKNIYSSDVDINDRKRQEITSSFSLSKPIGSRSINVSGNYTENLETDIKNITLPSVSYSLPSQPIAELFHDNVKDLGFWGKFSYTYSVKGIHQGKITQKDASLADVLYESNSKVDSLGKPLNYHRAAMQHNYGLSFSDKLSFLNFRQSFTGREAWFDRDSLNTKFVRGNDWSSSTSMSFSLYGVKKFNNSNFITAVRHIVTPSVSFSYAPSFKGKNSGLYSVGGISVSNAARRRNIIYKLSNKWQLKVKQDNDKPDKKINEFLSISTSTSQNLEKDTKQFQDLRHYLRFSPGNFDFETTDFKFSSNANITQNPYNWNVKRYNIGANVNFSEPFSFTDFFPKVKNSFSSVKFFSDDSTKTEEIKADSFKNIDKLNDKEDWNLDLRYNYSYNMETHKATHSIDPSANFKISKYWKLEYSNHIDLEDKIVKSHELSATRDLGSWSLEVNYTKDPDYWSINLLLFNKNLPSDLKLETKDDGF